MASTIFLGIKNNIKSFAKFIIELPLYIKQLIRNVKNDIYTLRLKLNNLSESNIELGIYHIKKGNLGDAIFRFKLVEKYLDLNNKIACYFLGLIYLLKNNHKNSIIYLEKAGDEDKVHLLDFVKSIDRIQSVPMPIYELYRNINIDDFSKRFINNIHDVPRILITELNKNVTSLPENYKILDIGSNVGLLSYEIHKRLPDNLHITGIEIANQLTKQHDKDLYDKIWHINPLEYLQKNEQKYDLICSLNGFAFTLDIGKIFNNIFGSLNEGGYFAFAVNTDAQNIFLSNLLEFKYNNSFLFNVLEENGFEVLSIKEFKLEIKNNCSIFICKKQLKNE